VIKKGTALFLVCGLGVAAAAAGTGERPNGLVIVADDLGYGDAGFTGSREIKTPRLDALASGGIVFNNGYVTHSYCGPSRAGLLTGRYQARFGMEINCAYSPYDPHMGLPTSEKTFGTRMQAEGYRTGMIGKWHLGAAPPYQPNQRGFDYFYGFLGGGHTYLPEEVSLAHPLVSDSGQPVYDACEGYRLPLVRNDQAAEFNEYLTTALSRDAARFVADSEQPFCLYLAYNAPHAPLQAPRETIAKYTHIDDGNRRIYAAMIDEMDRGIGLVVDALKESGKFENTLIIFLSDNGGVAPKEGKEQEDWADNGPLREGKGSLLEGGIRVPFFVHWPDGLSGGKVYDGLVSALDIAPTALAVAGGEAAAGQFDGVNLLPYLTGKAEGSPHDALFWREAEGACWAVRTVQAKYLKKTWNASGFELYDMQKDPHESENILQDRPELRARMAALWNAWNAENKPNVLPQSYDYQKRRLELFSDQYKQLETEAAKRPPLVIE
jgi:arylsulfatase A-like enzyme